MIDGFTVCALFYGDHLDLAARCIDSILKHPDLSRPDPHAFKGLRIACNDVSPRVRNYINLALAENRPDCPIRIYNSATNACKYPMMRRMIYDTGRPIDTTHIMWFDDDSCIKGGLGWWSRTYQAACNYEVMGDVWVVKFDNKQDWVKHQPWYTGTPWKKFRGEEVMEFATGGWWTARVDFLKHWNYPWAALRHRGGDCTLGALVTQQGLRLGRYKDGLWINADAQGRNSKAKRRGVDEDPIWYHYREGVPIDFSHQLLDVQIFDG
jgi:hypothetical protein